MTPDQRFKLIDILVQDHIEAILASTDFAISTIRNGFKGFNNFTDEELLKAHVDAFETNFLEEV